MGTYIRLTEYKTPDEKQKLFFNEENKYISTDDSFKLVPRCAYSYWLSDKEKHIFADNPNLEDNGRLCLGMRTGDNNRFLRLWYEVSSEKLGLSEDARTSKKWYPYNKGGEYRKWYGNLEYVVNWENDGEEIKANTRLVYPQLGDNLGWKISNEDKYFTEGIAWSRISTYNFGVRYCSSNIIFDTAAPMMFPHDNERLLYILGFMCSKLATSFLQVINPTIAFQVGDVAKLPLIIDGDGEIDKIVTENISIANEEWDEFETSWDFKSHPLI